ncbi:M48 family metalloprotease [Streptomyces sp. ISL-43]|uniref:M48 family metalloprotease n=1 Tax=Streptomyces sp. ISL-43 TaxID=2819183 RepID=UPI001BEAA962|nr:M48 family metalloprotease [Streptomyces sp. ISL-43]MBT2448614.1 M48 family metalloprotease [Streptomyces sp. ISL-43]
MFLRALLFWFALTVAAGAIAFPTTPDSQAQAASNHRSCAAEIESEFRRTLPYTAEEAQRAAATPFWQRTLIPEPYRSEVAETIARKCGVRPVDRPEQRAGLAVGVLAGGGFLLYWLLPYLTILRYGLKSEHPQEAGAVAADGTPLPCLDTALRRLAADAGVTVHAVLFNAVDNTANAVAFGHAGRRYIELASGMEGLLVKDPAAFDAVVLHELGHIRNRDLDVTQGITALWWAFVTLVAAAFCLSLTGFAADGSGLRALCLQLALLTCVVYAARNSYLHSRELHADAFAAAHPAGADNAEASRQSLDRFLVRLAEQRPDKGGETSAWPFATHPSLARRRAALVRPALADEFTGWEAALIGCILTFAVNLVLVHSFDLTMFALRTGILELADLHTLRPVYVWATLPLLLVAGPVIGLGLRYSVLAWGSPHHRGVHLTTRLARLSACLWAGLCLGCLIHPGPITDEHPPDEQPVMLWQSLTDSAVLGLAVTAAVSLGLCTLLVLGTEAVALRRRPALLLTGVYGALVPIAWFPTALPAATTPYRYTVVFGLPLLGAVCLLLSRRSQPARLLQQPVRDGHGPGTVTAASSPMRTSLLVVCHLTTLGVTAWALVVAGRLLTFSTSPTPLVLAKSLGLMLFVLGIAGAALAPHDTVFRQRVRAAMCCLAGAAALTAVEGLVVGTIPPSLCLTLLAPACGVLVSSRVTAAALYDLRRGRAGLPRAASAPPFSAGRAPEGSRSPAGGAHRAPRSGLLRRTAHGAHESRRPQARQAGSEPRQG